MKFDILAALKNLIICTTCFYILDYIFPYSSELTKDFTFTDWFCWSCKIIISASIAMLFNTITKKV